ncbi:MAG TPA: TerB family tellurite resistance protein [Chryseosolibacter sp.]|nr:TerB family tellurite resistance protein [Chryseosolibacter sp.]
MEQTTNNVLSGYSDQEKGAYLGAIASIATVDRSATKEELDHLRSLAKAADLSTTQEKALAEAAMKTSVEELKDYLNVLKNSELKFSLVADIITFAKVDHAYTEEEKTSIKKIADYLQVDQQQFALLDEFVDKAGESNRDPEEVRKPGFFESLGLKDKFEKAGININGLSRGLLGMLGPILLGKLVFGGSQRANQPFGQNRTPGMSGGGFGSLGSIFSMLNKGGSYRGMGSILPKIFK